MVVAAETQTVRYEYAFALTNTYSYFIGASVADSVINMTELML